LRYDPKATDRLSRTVQKLRDAVTWCTNRQQLRQVAARIRAVHETIPTQELDRLRSMWNLRFEQVQGDPR
jgi:hypothetical protein